MLSSTTLAVSMLLGISAPSCSGAHALEVGVVAVHQPIAEGEALRVADVEELARRSGRALRHRPLGFYTGGFGQTILIDREVRTAQSGECSNVTIVTVQLFLTNRVIEVANDVVAVGCQREVVWDHYRKHAAADDVVLSQYVQPVTIALRQAWSEMQDLLPPDGNTDTERLKNVVQIVLEKELQDYDQIRAKALTDVDNTPNIDELLCGRKA